MHKLLCWNKANRTKNPKFNRPISKAKRCINLKTFNESVKSIKKA